MFSTERLPALQYGDRVIVDSTFLLKTAYDVLRDKCLAITAVPCSESPEESRPDRESIQRIWLHIHFLFSFGLLPIITIPNLM